MKDSKQNNRKHKRRYYLLWIYNQYREHKGMIMLLLLLTVVSTTLAVLFPIVFKHIIDSMVSNMQLFSDGELDMPTVVHRQNRMLPLLLVLGLAPIFAGVYTYLRARMNIIFEKKYRENFFANIMGKPHRFFLKFRTGDLVTRLTEDVRTWPPGLAWLCCSGIFRAVNSTCLILFCLVGMLYLNVRLALIAVVPLPFMMLIFLVLEKSVEGRFKLQQKCMSETNDFLDSALSGIKIIKSFNAEKSQKTLFETLMNRRVEVEVGVERLEGLFMMYFEFLNYLGTILVMIFGGIMVVRGDLTIGTYYAFFSYLGMVVHPLMDIPMLLVSLAQSFVTIDRLEEIEDTEAAPAETSSEGKVTIDSIDSIEFNGVTFVHSNGNLSAERSPDRTVTPGESFEFRDLTFSVNRGEKIAVVGRIGSGKTTLLNLVAGVYTPDSGRFSVNGVDHSMMDVASYRGRIGYIQQEPLIFSETVAVNIDFWRGKERAWLEDCSRLAQFADEVNGFPEKYEQKVGQRGVTLSGGQRQRLSIARAVAGTPELLLMDDVTSSLDAQNEQQLWRDLAADYPELTCLIVTHRLSTAQNADRIMVLDNGRIDAIGTHSQLESSNPIYQELLNH